MKLLMLQSLCLENNYSFKYFSKKIELIYKQEVGLDIFIIFEHLV